MSPSKTAQKPKKGAAGTKAASLKKTLGSSVPAPAGTKTIPAEAEPLRVLRAEVAALREALQPRPAPAAGAVEELDAIRRTVNDLLERRMDAVVRDLVGVRQAALNLAGADELVGALDSLLSRLGAVPFEAQRLDHVDPLIHAVSREAHEPELPDGVIAASLRPGFRTARGVVLVRAQVSVNRRS